MKSKPNSCMTPEKIKHHAEILSNRVLNRFRHLSRRFVRQNIDCFRLYDWDIPEARAVVDWYAGHLVVGEYVRWQTGPTWLSQMAAAVGKALDISPDRIHVKRRRTKTKEGPRYRKRGSKGERLIVRERNLRFWVNLDDFLDTGLYSDHRDTRVIVGKHAARKNFLNLYGYTGAFTCAAAAGGAKTTVTVDRSDTYLKWARDNLELNGLWDPRHTLIQSDVNKYLARACREGLRFSLAFIDPPSFFRDRSQGAVFDINRDHPDLIRNVLKVMAPGSLVFFSTNHQRFEPHLEDLRVRDLKELTPASIPEDYRNKRVHRCWQMTAV
ncbi:MAG TPA: SAM-dependent methyltransferase [Candidatus Omnitrophica bacterium]|nr:SAM-dependent methyltransferase [Candidatus Omnitrophota bacterium]